MADVSYHEHSPEAHLSPLIECFWSIKTSAAVTTGVPPDGCVDVVFSPDFGLRAVGAMTTEQIFPLNAGTQVIGVRFRPGMASSVLGISAAELTDTFVDLETLWSQFGRELKARLHQSGSATEQITLLCQAVKPFIKEVNPIQKAIAAIASAHGNINLDDLASQTNVSSRQFRRRCREAAGLTPKHLCRILRFRRARQLAHTSPQISWSSIAAETGYFDQAHLIRDFREFTARTPMSVLSNTAPVALA